MEPANMKYTKIYSPQHPRADITGHVPEHILIMEKKLGRPIQKDEIVHHIDLDKLNNDKSNIYVCETNSNHLSIHRQLESIAGGLVKDGFIIFKNSRS